jgi:hypothetical protein
VNKTARETFKKLAEYMPEQVDNYPGKMVMELLADIETAEARIAALEEERDVLRKICKAVHNADPHAYRQLVKSTLGFKANFEADFPKLN